MTRHPDTSSLLAECVASLRDGAHTSREDTADIVAGMLDGTLAAEAFGEWLVALADLGESATEITGVADALRARMRPIRHDLPLVADTCGTGGDGSGTFNISTAAAIVAAAAGLPVAKHGNRAVSSRTGSGDVLESLGVRIDVEPDVSCRALCEIGLCFCLAPTHHPAMARVGPLRRSLRRPTVFNLVGPLCNPAGAGVQVIGVGRPGVREAVAATALALGARRVLVVSGTIAGDPARAFDEVSLFGPTDVIDVSASGTRHFRWSPEDFGIATHEGAMLAALSVEGPADSGRAIRDVLAGSAGPRRDIVVLNAAAVLWAAGRADHPAAAARLAAAALDSGAAAEKLAGLVRLTQSPAA